MSEMRSLLESVENLEWVFRNGQACRFDDAAALECKNYMAEIRRALDEAHSLLREAADHLDGMSGARSRPKSDSGILATKLDVVANYWLGERKI